MMFSFNLDKYLHRCVINNRPSPFAEKEDIINNRETMMIMKDLIRGEPPDPRLAGTNITALAREVLSTPLPSRFCRRLLKGARIASQGRRRSGKKEDAGLIRRLS